MRKKDTEPHNFLKNTARLKKEFKLKADTKEFNLLWKSSVEAQQWMIKIGVILEKDMTGN